MLSPLLPLLAALLLTACSDKPREASETPDAQPRTELDFDAEVKTLSAEEARRTADRIRQQANLAPAEGLEISLWASEQLLKDPVAINIDYQGRLWAAITHRSNNSEFDIRGRSEWMDASQGFESVEDRRDFLRAALAPERSDDNPWLPDRNEDGVRDWRDLAVVQEEVLLIEDTHGDGLADRSSVFIRAFDNEITDVLGGIFYHNQRDELHLSVAPDHWRVKDTTGDGKADTKESLSHGFGVHIGFSGHGMSGTTLGPDGRIYYGIGDIGANIVDDQGNNHYYPNEGVIARSEPDGSNFEIFAAGLRNTHEFTFDQYGNLISVDNDGDHEEEHERVVYLVDGSDTGWRINWQFGKYTDPKNNTYKVLMEEGYYKTAFDGQAAHLLPPIAAYHSGPAGMTFNPGTALGEEWRNHFFVAEFVGTPTRSGINAFTLEPRGASFALASDRNVMRGIQVTGMDFGPDGALYFADWIDGWHRNQRGRVWKLDIELDADALRRETQQLLAADFDPNTVGELAELLAHPDMRVRSKAQFELVERRAGDTLLQVAQTHADQLARIHGLWGLGQLARADQSQAAVFEAFLTDEDPEIRAQAARLLGDVRYAPALPALSERALDDNARVRFFAVEALGRIGDEAGLEAVLAMLEHNDDEDVYLRHGGAIALERIGAVERIAALAEHDSRALRIAAVVALRRLGDPAIARFLDDDDEFVVTNAARGINDDLLIEAAVPALAAMLDQDRFTNEALLRRAINAAVYSGTREDAERLVRTARNARIDAALRGEALNALATWPETSIYDRVSGWQRGAVSNDLADAQDSLGAHYQTLLQDPDHPVRTAVVNALSGLGFEGALPAIDQLLDHDPAEAVRVAALDALVSLGHGDMRDAVFRALNDQSQAVRSRALAMVPNLDVPVEDVVAMHALVIENASVAEQQTALASLATIDAEPAHALLRERLRLLIAGEIIPDVQLDLVLAAEAVDDDNVNELLVRYQASKDENDKLDLFRESLYGGNWGAGRYTYRFNPAAQCVRCHVVGERGSHVGPELTYVADRLSREQLLEAMVDPHARIAAGYGNIALTTTDGERVEGFFEAETGSTVTVLVQGESRTVARADIAEASYSPSGMPAMDRVLSREDLRNLVEYLSSLSEENWDSGMH
ncbi:HEAT repeat domain-containing protein [Marinimicrobium alkaliphilum]|uniref:HEAT repeat domain-containing protein n=1 Tax=Marinimicrobium alkaliphilum TaxID=2202654 RepID=UPI0018E0AA7E|nr:HEAT repeat domain-containing protein [Marinimicrobium alkaliphilum]